MVWDRKIDMVTAAGTGGGESPRETSARSPHEPASGVLAAEGSGHGGAEPTLPGVALPASGPKIARPSAATRSPGHDLPDSQTLAQRLPVARLLVDIVPAHLDRPFEYLVPAHLDDLVRPGVRVKVRFAGQEVTGYVLERVAEPEHQGRLSPIRRVIGADAVLTPSLAELATELAATHAGTRADVLRLAIPPRHARAEKACAPEALEGDRTTTGRAAVDTDPPSEASNELANEPSNEVEAADEAEASDIGPWSRYPAGASFVRRLRAGESPAAAWSALPIDGGDWARALAVAAAATLDSGRGVVIVVPDHRDVGRIDAALTARLGSGRHVRLTADQGPQARYSAWLALLRGHVRCVVGSRAAALAPVRDPGLWLWWDDGDDLHEEPRAPYFHVREVLSTRARLEGGALLTGGFARSVAVQDLVRTGALREILPETATRRSLSARVHVAGQGQEEERDGPAVRAHLPSSGWRAAREALLRGPVLVQVPRRGYLPALSCAHCRERARCPACHAPLAVGAAQGAPTCVTCGLEAPLWQCPECGGRQLRRSAVGARRTAEELGRAFPDVPVRTSGSGEVLERVPPTPALVIATPGAEPLVDGGYAAALLLDAWAVLDRPTLDAGEEALRRWLAAAALVRGRERGGVVVLAGAPTHDRLPPVEALVRWAPEWFAERELAERAALRLPPTVWTARLSGTQGALRDALAALPDEGLPPAVERIGPVPTEIHAPDAGSNPRAGGAAPIPEADRPAHVLLRADPADAPAATAALGRFRRVRSVRKDAAAIGVRVGAHELGG